MRATVEDRVRRQPHRGGASPNPTDRELVVQRRLAGLGLEQIDDDEAGARLEFCEERKRILDVLDHVKGEGSVEAGRNVEVEIVNRRIETAPFETPAEVCEARVCEVGELDPVTSLEQKQTVGANPASVIENPRAGLDQASQLGQIGQLRAGHREGRQVVEVSAGAAIKVGLGALEPVQFPLQRQLVLLQQLVAVAFAKIGCEFGLLTVRVEPRLDVNPRHSR